MPSPKSHSNFCNPPPKTHAPHLIEKGRSLKYPYISLFPDIKGKLVESEGGFQTNDRKVVENLIYPSKVNFAVFEGQLGDLRAR